MAAKLVLSQSSLRAKNKQETQEFWPIGPMLGGVGSGLEETSAWRFIVGHLMGRGLYSLGPRPGGSAQPTHQFPQRPISGRGKET